MEEDNPVVVECANCGSVLHESADLPIAERKACPECGCLARGHKRGFQDGMEIHDNTRLKAKRGGKGEPYYRAKVGDSRYKKSGKWMDRRMIIDRDRVVCWRMGWFKGWYEELITNTKTGEIIRDCAEPLAWHRGRGSAKHSKMDG